MHWFSGSTPEIQQQVLDEDKKHKFQVILIIDAARNVASDLSVVEKYRNATNAEGEPLVHSVIVGWDKVNNIHPDAPLDELAEELKTGVALAQMIREGIPIWLTVSYTPGANLEEWYQAVKVVPHSGIWLWNVWGWDANLQTPANWLKAKGETNFILGGLYGWKYWYTPYREDLVKRGAEALPGYWNKIKSNGYSGVAILQNIYEKEPFGSMRVLDEQGNPNELYTAISKLK